MMNKKTPVIFLICLSMLLLTGWGLKKIELLDDSRLVDLDKAMEYARPGGAFNPQQGNPNAEDGMEGQAQYLPSSDKASVEKGDASARVIRVRDEAVFYDGKPTSIEQLRTTLQKDAAAQLTCRLVDDWAEAGTYKKVLAILEELKLSGRLSFTEGQTGTHPDN